jgi:hypothetical protein
VLELLGAVVVGVSPVASLIALVVLLDVRRRRWREIVERQIAVTDAIHRELGAVVAPVVHRRGRTWRVSIAVPFGAPPVVERVVDIVHRAFQPCPHAIVLTPQPAVPTGAAWSGPKPTPAPRAVAAPRGDHGASRAAA